MLGRTPLLAAHHALGARMVEFAGWEMPLAYSGALEEHRAVRERCGLFDVSHMGEIEVRGPEAGALCQYLTVNDVRRLRIGDAQYTLFCNPEGGVLDDLVISRLGAERYLLVVNAARTAADVEWIRAHARPGAEVSDRSAELALVALQGPRAEAALRPITPLDLGALRSFAVADGAVAGHGALVSRTGYTGEDGFELVVREADARPVWDAVLEAARGHGGMPAGLGARDTLRLEAGLLLCGTDVDASTTPLEAGLGWVVKLGKGPFVGQEALAAQCAEGVARKLVGIRLDEPGIPRHGFPVWRGGSRIGRITSGARSPTLGTCIGLGYVTPDAASPGTMVGVEIRGRLVPGHVEGLPFYRRVRKEA